MTEQEVSEVSSSVIATSQTATVFHKTYSNGVEAVLKKFCSSRVYERELCLLEHVRGSPFIIDVICARPKEIYLSYVPYNLRECRPPKLLLNPVLAKVAAGLLHMHSRGVIHSDVKAQNILVSEDYETVKICDFSTSFYVKQTTDHVESPSVRCTVTHLLPDVYECPTVCARDIDVWSLGALYCEAAGYELCDDYMLRVEILPDSSRLSVEGHQRHKARIHIIARGVRRFFPAIDRFFGLDTSPRFTMEEAAESFGPVSCNALCV